MSNKDRSHVDPLFDDRNEGLDNETEQNDLDQDDLDDDPNDDVL